MAWETLLAVVEDNREAQRHYETRVPVECENDGTALVAHPRKPGVLRCPFDGWEYPTDATATRRGY